MRRLSEMRHATTPTDNNIAFLRVSTSQKKGLASLRTARHRGVATEEFVRDFPSQIFSNSISIFSFAAS
jgi:hypothetical protein